MKWFHNHLPSPWCNPQSTFSKPHMFHETIKVITYECTYVIGNFNKQLLLKIVLHSLAKRFWEPVRQPYNHPSWASPSWERSSTVWSPSNGRIKAVNHALIARPWFFNQVWGPVSLVSKDTEVRSYRTDPVQVRSWPMVLFCVL